MSSPFKAQINRDLVHDLWRLAETGDLRRLEDLLARGVDVNARNQEGATALMMAAYQGQLEVVRALTDHGADLNATDFDGDTAVMLADHSGHEDIVRLLIARGAKAVSKPPAPEVLVSPIDQEETFDSFEDVELPPAKRRAEVRTLHDPPEIWDLVHESTTDFNPRSALVRQLASKNGLLLMLVTLVVGGGAVFGFMKLRHSAANTSASSPVRAEGNDTKAGSSPAVIESAKTVPVSEPSPQDTAPVTVPSDVKNNEVPEKTNVGNNVA